MIANTEETKSRGFPRVTPHSLTESLSKPSRRSFDRAAATPTPGQFDLLALSQRARFIYTERRNSRQLQTRGDFIRF